MIGKTIDRYTIIDILGEGGMAKVYKARDPVLQREVAIKVIHPLQQEKEAFLLRFDQEAKLAAGLTQTNIVSVFDYGVEAGLPYLVMEYIPGGTLKDRLGGAANERVPWDFAVRQLLPIAHALEYAHQEGIIHRDIKPANLLVTESGELMLSDFGIAKLLKPESDPKLTKTGVQIGTLQYMAPEQKRGEAVDARADIYSLGVVLYEMVTGWIPDAAVTPPAVIREYMQAVALPEALRLVLAKAIEKDPAARFQSMAEFASALELLLTSEAPTPQQVARIAPPADPLDTVALGAATWEPGEGGRKYNPNPWMIGLVLVILVGICTIGVVGTTWGVAAVMRLRQTAPTSQAALAVNPATAEMPATPSPTRQPASPTTLAEREEILAAPERQTEPPQAPTGTSAPSPSPEPTITPTVLGGGGLIAFHSDRSGNNDLYVMNSDGSNVRQLTFDPSDERAPAWSPDGKSLAFQSNLDGDYEIYILDLLNGYRWQVTKNDCNDLSPGWSPDGRQFVFYSDCDGNREIYIMNADGENLRQLTETSGVYNWFGVWSPDGKQIAFSSNRNGKYQVFVMNADGSAPRALADGCVPFYSPDGTKIVFNQYCTDSGNIWVMAADGSQAHAVTAAPQDFNRNPSWSADGQEIVFQREQNGFFEIWVMAADGSNWQQLTDDQGKDSVPVWQPPLHP
jgi:Tol biopolymer transport system component/tRNA A-37 threonylcarbamoyl transferase component Bud32